MVVFAHLTLSSTGGHEGRKYLATQTAIMKQCISYNKRERDKNIFLKLIPNNSAKAGAGMKGSNCFVGLVDTFKCVRYVMVDRKLSVQMPLDKFRDIPATFESSECCNQFKGT
jgi:hypothetical protein